MATEETLTLTIESDDDSEELEVPAELIEMLAEDDEGAPAVVADIALFGLAQRAHAAVHHSDGQPEDDLLAAEELTMELFEERFGMSYGEATGHAH